MLLYHMLLQDILNNGEKREDRTGIGTLAVFGKTLTIDLTQGFPAITTKKLFFKSVAAELAGFLEGTESAARMRELGTSIWDANANAEYWQENKNCRGLDDMGRVYGVQWRNWQYTNRLNKQHSIDQLREVVQRLIGNPTDRRLIVTAWNPGDLSKMCLPPCHIFFQFFVRNSQYLDCQWYIRSVDSFLGMPFDIASYALLMHIVAQQVDLVPGKMTMVTGDTHIYLNHLKQVKEMLQREPYLPPILHLSDEATIDNFHPSMAKLVNYEHHPEIKASMAV